MGTPQVAVIGGGIAGVAAAFYLAERARVVLLEAEPTLAYHTTGRSAALLFESYGSPGVRPLTLASRSFFDDPPPGLADFPFLSERGGLLVGDAGQEQYLREWEVQAHRSGTRVEWLDARQARELCPALREDGLIGAVWEPDAADMDVAAIHQAFVRGARRRGAQIRVSSPVTALEKTAGGWEVTAGRDILGVQVVVNAAGAWGDEVARLAGVAPVGITPMRRTVFMAPGSEQYRDWPLVANGGMEWYFKPDGTQLLCSLSEENPSPPCDARPEPLDIALAIDRINGATTLEIRAVRSSWTGLRTFAPDREMVIGFDPPRRGFLLAGGTGRHRHPDFPGRRGTDSLAGAGLQGLIPAARSGLGSRSAESRTVLLMPFRVSITRPLDPQQFTDRLALFALFGFGAAGFILGGWAEGVRAGLAAYLSWALCREIDPDHPVSANLAALAGGALALALETHAGVLFVMLLVVKVLVGGSGLSPAGWEAAALGLGAVVFAGTLNGWWAGMAMAVALFLDTWTYPLAPDSHRWIAGAVGVGASIFYALLGMPDPQWRAYVGAVVMAALCLAYGRSTPVRRLATTAVVAGLPAGARLVGMVDDAGFWQGSVLEYALLAGGLAMGAVLCLTRIGVASPTDHADHTISPLRVRLARCLVVAFLVVSWASASSGSVTEMIAPAAPLWAAVILVGFVQLARRAMRG